MKKDLLILVCLLLFGCDYQKNLVDNEVLPPEAFFAINDWSAQRAYPYDYVDVYLIQSDFYFAYHDGVFLMQNSHSADKLIIIHQQ